MTDKNWVKCTITYYYNKNTYLYVGENEDDLLEGEEVTPPSEEEILLRCKMYMIEDVTDFNNPIDTRSVRAEFVEEPIWEEVANG
jgi:hypothetical protein